MATLPNPLPKLAADPTGRTLGLELPPGKVIDALLWHADTAATPGDWTALKGARTVGLLPLLVDVGGGQGGPEAWELMPDETSYPGDHDAEEVLAEYWEDTEDDDWPGLAPEPPASPGTPDPDALATETADRLLTDGTWLKDPRVALVPARRSADIPAAIGWSGPVNHENDVARLCAVLRSWEDRFGIRVVALTFDQLIVSVAAPPTTPEAARSVAAEHDAFCPDTIDQSGSPSLDAYAEQLVDREMWSFWWD
ncbi:DUF4253 domain-containing protein [Streptomyces chromofuscus]|uniref:DUF4253 domain-containing protein n=1 Tax=Streptomyces chromofuscus TaxID=42881 RepID=A0A7M2T3K0_STRCW|nr:DUF4253 domain-containing protein [Streptomyces chromofuscus]QOV42258.1 DUF4253 domain-containing protein [Streptomyces chromofuscus]GGT34067.1 hypothetical protein GCM10010254_63110 [Streptomyces chromofuscus]